MTGDALTALPAPRDVLLRSIRDLEQERAAGEIGDDDYAALKDDYTARAAAVLRAIEAGRPSGARRPRPRPRPRPAGARPARWPPGARSRPGPRPSPARRTRGGRAADAQAQTQAGRRPAATRAGRAAATGRRPASTDRRPASTDRRAAAASRHAVAADPGPTGGRRPAATTTPTRRRPAANPAVGRRPRTLAVSLAVAFVIAAVAGLSVVLLAGGRSPGEPVTGSVPGGGSSGEANRVDEALALEADGRAVDALKLYDEILAGDPDNVEALAYRGWLLKRAGLPDEAMESLDRAVAVDPTFADAHFFRGMVLLQDRADPAGAVVEFRAFLANDPPDDFVAAVEEVLANAEAAAAAKAAGTGTTTTVAP